MRKLLDRGGEDDARDFSTDPGLPSFLLIVKWMKEDEMVAKKKGR